MEKSYQKIISRSVTDTSLFYRLNNGEITLSENLNDIVHSASKLNIVAIARYIGSDNLVSLSPFTTVFNGIGRIPAGTETTFDGSNVKHKPLCTFTDKIDPKLLVEHFQFPKKNVSLLFSGGLDSSLFLAANPGVKHLYHLNYHGEGSRTNHVARTVANYFNKELIEINPEYDKFSIINYCDTLSKGITGIQSPSQYCFNLSLKQKISFIDAEYLVSGQNCDTMLYVDHHHAPTQLILHERLNQTIAGFSARHKIWKNPTKSDLENTKIALLEHMGTPSNFQRKLIEKFGEQFKDEYINLELPSVSPLAELKLMRWFRGSASVNDNFNLLRLQTGINRIPGLHYTNFLPTALHLQPSFMNLFFCKVEVAKLFKKIAGINHRDLVIHGILGNFMELSKSKKIRTEEALRMHQFNHTVICELLELRRDSVKDLLDEIDLPFLNDLFKSIEAKNSFNAEDYTVIHKIINLDLYVRNLR